MDLENKGQKAGGKSEKKGVPRIHGKHAPWELLFPRSALFLLIILWKNHSLRMVNTVQKL